MEPRTEVIHSIMETSEYLLDRPLAQLFRDLGFVVDWDFDRRTGLHWYEIRESRNDPREASRLLIQIDSWAPLAEVVDELPRMAESGISAPEAVATWQVRGPMVNLQQVGRRIRAWEFSTSG